MGSADPSRKLSFFQGMGVHFEIISYLIKIHSDIFAYISGLFFIYCFFVPVVFCLGYKTLLPLSPIQQDLAQLHTANAI
jgi:hypothetical protein